MILSFYDKDFKGLQNNASLVVENKSFRLKKRPIENDEFSCTCEAFTENIQPTFIVVKNDLGNNRELIYSCLAGVPQITSDNKTDINGTDLKTMFSSKVILEYNGTYTTIGDVLRYLFDRWNEEANQYTINCELIFIDNADKVNLESLKPTAEKSVYNVLDEIKAYLSAYNLYIESKIDLVERKVKFYIGKTLSDDNPQIIKLWEYGIKNYGKWISSINEVQGYTDNWDLGERWILTSDNKITTDTSLRDIYPIKRDIVVAETLDKANIDALKKLLNSRYNENLVISSIGLNVGFNTKFDVYVDKEKVYKSLPCGELRYNVDGIYEVQIGYRYTGIDFI